MQNKINPKRECCLRHLNSQIMENNPGDPGSIHSASGTRAASAPNIRPSRLRLFRYDDGLRYLFGLFLILAIGGGALTYGSKVLYGSNLGVEFLAWMGIILGAIILLCAILLLVLCILSIFHGAMCYKNGLMSTGIVMSLDPVTVLYMTNISTGIGPSLHGLRLISHRWFPGKPQIGEEIPAVSVFKGEGFSETWDTFTPTPLIFGTANRKMLEAAHNALSRTDFDVMRQCIQEATIPKSPEELTIIEESGTYVEIRKV